MSISILAHRGWWLEPAEKNSYAAIRRAFDNGFGVETDLRDYCGEVVISHDIPRSPKNKFSDLMILVSEYGFTPELALNVKADGLQCMVKEVLGEYSNYFFFDMSVPDCLGYKKNGLNFYSRRSEVESPSLYDDCSGVWLDRFFGAEIEISFMEKALIDGKRVALVSPELHGFEYKNYWSVVREFVLSNSGFGSLLSICTDFPGEAKEFFYGA